MSSSVKRAKPKVQPKPKVRKHEGIRQTGTKRGTLKKGYKYTGEQNMNGAAKIVKTKK